MRLCHDARQATRQSLAVTLFPGASGFVYLRAVMVKHCGARIFPQGLVKHGISLEVTFMSLFRGLGGFVQRFGYSPDVRSIGRGTPIWRE
jgi:hypothetical protein